MNDLYCIALYSYTSVGGRLSGLERAREIERAYIFQSFLTKGYIFEVALSERLDNKQPLACLFTGEGYWLSECVCVGGVAQAC